MFGEENRIKRLRAFFAKYARPKTPIEHIEENLEFITPHIELQPHEPSLVRRVGGLHGYNPHMRLSRRFTHKKFKERHRGVTSGKHQGGGYGLH